MLKRGFTLLELLVVMGIVGILAGATITILNPEKQLQRARDSRRTADLAQLQSAFELYRSDQGSYPSSLPACSSPLSVAGTEYLKSRPCDPKNTGQFIYTYVTVGSPPSSYSIISCLENVDDKAKDTTNNATYCTGGTTNWSYTVNNP